MAHPTEPLSLAGRLALAIGLVLFVGGMAVAVRRATGNPMWARMILILTTAIVIVAIAGASVVVTLGISLTGILAILVLEQRAKVPIVVERP